jgi:hypothetical protein
LYFKGVSLRKAADHLKQLYNFEVDYSSICRCIRKFVDLVQPYVDGLVPNMGGVYHVDEMLLHVRKENNEQTMNDSNEAYQKELFTLKTPRIQNVRSISIGHQGLNSKVERLNGTMRDRETVIRGLDNAEAGQELLDAMRIITIS